MMKLTRYGVRLCESCEHIHFDLYDGPSDDSLMVSMTLDDGEWDSFFIAVNKMRRQRDQLKGVKLDG